MNVLPRIDILRLTLFQGSINTCTPSITCLSYHSDNRLSGVQRRARVNMYAILIAPFVLTVQVAALELLHHRYDTVKVTNSTLWDPP